MSKNTSSYLFYLLRICLFVLFCVVLLFTQWDFDEYAKTCKEERGVTPLEYWAETNYGGRDIKYHSNIVFR